MTKVRFCVTNMGTNRNLRKVTNKILENPSTEIQSNVLLCVLPDLGGLARYLLLFYATGLPGYCKFLVVDTDCSAEVL